MTDLPPGSFVTFTYHGSVRFGCIKQNHGKKLLVQETEDSLRPGDIHTIPMELVLAHRSRRKNSQAAVFDRRKVA